MTQNLRIVFSILLLSIALLGCIDLALDWGDTGLLHTAVEGMAILLCLVLLGLIWRQIERTIKISESDRGRTELEFLEFKRRNRDTLDQFRSAMHDQFARWNFSQTEMRVAEGLIRGYSLREIAGRANRSVKTVRNQSTSVYGKAGMTGRADLAAFFLSDLMGEDSDE
ncbi:MAG: helix-turn-helix transcriptional regulator [Spirochaetia bacterium]|nr:helix-turn-helix transcriptional regulator [Spirochaetia bacterium]